MVQNDTEMARLHARLAALDAERSRLKAQLERLQTGGRRVPATEASSAATALSHASSNAAKIALFRSLFRGRDDVFARRWSNQRSGRSGYAPACANEWVPKLCAKPKVKCGDCPNQQFLPVTDDVVARHLRGVGADGADFTIGVYPLLPDNTCWFLAADFDKSSWRRDSAAFADTCRCNGVPAALERSRSGNGGHVWIFFAAPVAAALARQLGTHLLTETLRRVPDLGFASYDRLFPNQDTMPAGGFGNLIALPLQARPRESGNSVFLDDAFAPHADQWRYLASLRRMTPGEVASAVETRARHGPPIAVRLPLDDDDEPWLAPPSRRGADTIISGPLPDVARMFLGDQIYIERANLPPPLVDQLLRLAAFQNPAFYSAQAMRLPTFGIPRVIACAELLSRHIALPRGCRDQVSELLSSLGIGIDCQDQRHTGRPIETSFQGTLTLQQQAATDALLRHDIGVLAATTGFGKTVVAAAVIASRRTNTLILVHRRQLLEQWIARLSAFLDLPAKAIGQIGDGKRKPGGCLDVALIQSLRRHGAVDDVVAEYGHLVVDECHHLPAVSFEAVTRRCKAKYVLGLSATLTRRDGHHPIIFMQCGPARFRADARTQGAQRPFSHRVVLRATGFIPPPTMHGDRLPIQQIYDALANDDDRNAVIFDDVLKALEAGRSPVVLTERKDHARRLADRLARFAQNVITMHGGLGTRERRMLTERLAAIDESQERVLVATGRYIGDGFDDARLDTLFLTMPVSWRGTLAQYAGRLHRLHPNKREVIVYDYVDDQVAVLARMSARRVKGYQSLGYVIQR